MTSVFIKTDTDLNLKRREAIELPGGAGIRPPLKWAGGKRWLASRLKEIYLGSRQKSGSYRRLVEPFCGGLSVSLAIQPEQALLNDINDHSINFYRHLKKGLRMRRDMKNDQDFYYEARALFNELLEKKSDNKRLQAELFYYLNRTGYNGLCRFNKKGLFNVPFGSYKNINYTEDFRAYKEILKDWHFLSGDFELLDLKRDDFVYADPPYDVEFRQYAKEGFSYEDQIRLARWLASHRGPVVASNQATDRIMKLYENLGFKVKILSAPRMISCTGDRTRANEMLAIKNLD